MGNNKKRLVNLDITDFRHEDELPLEKAFLENPYFDKAMNAVSDIGVKAHETSILGQMILLSREVAPRLYEILYDVCDILNCDMLPLLYLRHSWVQVSTPIESDDIYIIVDDYIVENYDDDMLYYCFGNAVTMIKANHVRYSNIAAYMMPSNPLLSLLKLSYMPFVHAMDISSDRGGLLACQSFAAAVRCILVKAGIPITEVYNLFASDQEAEEYVRTYLKAVDRITSSTAGSFQELARKIQIAQSSEGAVNNMLRQLYYWYCDDNGYRAVVHKYGVST